MHRLASTQSRWAAFGAAVAVTFGAAGLGGYNLVSADVSSGDRPVFIPISPCRLADTRPAPNSVGARTTALQPDETITITVHGANGECAGASAIPADATALALNVTALNATSSTFLTLWGEGDNPGTANLNPAPGQPPTPNAVNTPLSAAGTFNLYNERGNVDVVIDVNGYYAPHDHDDRYYTETEADDRFAPALGDNVNLNVFGFEDPDATSGWDIGFTLQHTSTGGVECAVSPVALPDGRTIQQISVAYLNPDPQGTMAVALAHVRNARGAFTGETDIAGAPIPSVSQPILTTGDDTINTATFAADPALASTEANTSYLAVLCTDMDVTIINVSVDLVPL